MQETGNFQLGGPEKLAGADDPHALQKNGGMADLWYMDDGDVMCRSVLVPSFLQEFDVANARVGAARKPQKTEVVYYVNDLDAAPPEWRIRDVQNVAKVTTVTEGCITLGVAVWTSTVQRTSSWPRRRQNLLANGKVCELAASTTSCECTAIRSCRRNELLKSSTRLGSVLSSASSLASLRTV